VMMEKEGADMDRWRFVVYTKKGPGLEN